jgi:hypothetical protein
MNVCGAFVLLALALQVLPPPQDGDIRTVYWELQNRSEVFLTLELKSHDGKPAPVVTFTVGFAGKRPVSQPRAVEVRAYPGPLWWPRAEWWFLLDQQTRLDLAGRSSGLINNDFGPNYVIAAVPLGVLQQLADATSVSGNVLGFEVELSSKQRDALRAFRDRVMSM